MQSNSDESEGEVSQEIQDAADLVDLFRRESGRRFRGDVESRLDWSSLPIYGGDDE